MREAALLAVKAEEGATSQRCGASRGKDSPLETPEGPAPAHTWV